MTRLFLGFYNYTVLLTYVSVISGMTGIFYALQGRSTAAVICLMVSGFCDMFDGVVARTKKNRSSLEQSYGVQIDSLADMICFGVLPASIGYGLGLVRWYHLVILCVYVLTALIRLAYFNATEYEEHMKAGTTRKHYSGLPVTSTALIIPILFCFRPLLSQYFPTVYGLALLLVAFAFIAAFKLRKPKLKHLLIMVGVGSPIFVFLLCRMIRT
jgi:CDP-diacylglycerol--serine O-phosphatidyltransferase